MGLNVDILFAGIPVSDIAQGAGFYERLIGRPADVLVHDNEVMWHLADQGWPYVVTDPARAGHSLVSLAVTDLDATLLDLARRGLQAESLEEVPGAGRKANLLDPDGNSVALLQVVQPT